MHTLQANRVIERRLETKRSWKANKLWKPESFPDLRVPATLQAQARNDLVDATDSRTVHETWSARTSCTRTRGSRELQERNVVAACLRI